MGIICHVKDFTLGSDFTASGERLEQLLNSSRQRLVEVRLGAGDVLKRHPAAEPITVFCFAGEGCCRSGAREENLRTLSRGHAQGAPW